MSVGDEAAALGSVVAVDAVAESVGAGSIDCADDGGGALGVDDPTATPDVPLLQPVRAAAATPNVASPNPARAKALSGACGRPSTDASVRSAGALRRNRASTEFEPPRMTVAPWVAVVSFPCSGLSVSVAAEVLRSRTCISLPLNIPIVRNVAAHRLRATLDANRLPLKRIVNALAAMQRSGRPSWNRRRVARNGAFPARCGSIRRHVVYDKHRDDGNAHDSAPIECLQFGGGG